MVKNSYNIKTNFKENTVIVKLRQFNQVAYL